MLRHKAMRNLSFIKQTCAFFSDFSALITFYCSLIRSNLECRPLIWINDTLKQNSIIESV